MEFTCFCIQLLKFCQISNVHLVSSLLSSTPKSIKSSHLQTIKPSNHQILRRSISNRPRVSVKQFKRHAHVRETQETHGTHETLETYKPHETHETHETHERHVSHETHKTHGTNKTLETCKTLETHEKLKCIAPARLMKHRDTKHCRHNPASTQNTQQKDTMAWVN